MTTYSEMNKSAVMSYRHGFTPCIEDILSTKDKRRTKLPFTEAETRTIIDSPIGSCVGFLHKISRGSTVLDIRYDTGVNTDVLAMLPFDRPSIKPVQLSMHNRRGRNGLDIYRSIIARTLSHVVDKKVILSSHGMSAVEMSPRGGFQVHVFSHPNFEGENTIANHNRSNFFGYNVSGCHNQSILSADTHAVADKTNCIYDGDYLFAQVFSNAIYIYPDIINQHDEGNQMVFAKCMIEACKILGSDIDFDKLNEEYEARLAQQRAEREESEKREREEREERLAVERLESFERFVHSCIPREVARNESRKRDIQKSVEEAEKAYYLKQRELANFNLSVDKNAAMDRIMSDFEKLRNNFHAVDSVYVENDKLIIETDEIISYDRHNDNYHNIGKLKFSLPFGGNSSGAGYYVHVYPLGERGNSRRIPHICSDGNTVCFGTALGEISSYLANYEILTAVSLMIAFFEKGVDSDDEWGRKILENPIVEKPTTRRAA